jgi:hypothetical protein
MDEICEAMRFGLGMLGLLLFRTGRLWLTIVANKSLMHNDSSSSYSVAVGTPSKRLSVVLVRRGDCGSSKREAVDEEEAVRDERDLRGDDTLALDIFSTSPAYQPLLIYSFLLFLSFLFSCLACSNASCCFCSMCEMDDAIKT